MSRIAVERIRRYSPMNDQGYTQTHYALFSDSEQSLGFLRLYGGKLYWNLCKMRRPQ